MEGENLHPLQKKLIRYHKTNSCAIFFGGQLVVQEKRQPNFLRLDGEMLTVVR